MRYCLSILSIILFAGLLQAAPKNIVLIFVDDLGYSDLSCYGAKGYSTPHLDKMAAEGLKLTDFSTSSSVCSPSRAGLLTGRYAKRWGNTGRVFFPNSTNGMPQSEVTIAELLKKQNYSTAIIGKWHLGHLPEFLPMHQGFDHFYGIPYSNDMWQDHNAKLSPNVVFNNGLTKKDFKKPSKKPKNMNHCRIPMMLNDEVVEWPIDQSQITKTLTQKSQHFITENKDKPFFLYLAHTMPHVPLFVSKEFKGKSKKGIYADVIQELDWSVGEIIKTLTENNLDKNTLVIFTSDNGPWTTYKELGGKAGHFKSGKMTPFEGGSRVPCIIWQPGFIPAGITSDIQTSTLDMLPTIANLTGSEIPIDRVLDGVDITNTLKGTQTTPYQRKFFLYRGNNSIRQGNWKLHLKTTDSSVKRQLIIKETALYNLENDPSEKINLAKQQPEKVEQLIKLLNQANQQMAADK